MLQLLSPAMEMARAEATMIDLRIFIYVKLSYIELLGVLFKFAFDAFIVSILPLERGDLFLNELEGHE